MRKLQFFFLLFFCASSLLSAQNQFSRNQQIPQDSRNSRSPENIDSRNMNSGDTRNPLLVKPEDLRLEPEKKSGKTEGYHLFIRKIPGLESVMLTETTKDPSGESDNYAYRAFEYNPVNGDEIRYLNGKILDSEYSRFSLIDSSAEPDSEFGEAFHIYIPLEMQFGYPWSRNGTVKIGRGTFLNIRAFSKKYADYTGGFYDNPYMFDLGKSVSGPETEILASEPKPEAESETETENLSEDEEVSFLTDDYNPVASAKFEEISEKLVYSKGPDSIVDDIMDSLMAIDPKENVEVVFVLDTTGSMKDDIEKLRKDFIPRLVEGLKEFSRIRVGLLLYRDYGDSYRYKDLPVKFFDFTSDVSSFTKNLNAFTVRGNEGGDIPEAVYEGLYAALEFYRWSENSVRKIILIGDAEPHPSPRGTGKYTKKLVEKIAAEKNVSITAIITPDEKSRRGR